MNRAAPRSRRSRGGVVAHLLLAALTYVPLLLSAPGQVAADTKQYLYLDPGRLLSRAWSMWDPNVGAGTVTHQNIGYLFPMGPWYWLASHAGLPVWVAQRLWLATILFLAGAGVLFLLRTLGTRGTGAAVAALAYALSPYALDYAGRISVILLPYAGLGWMIGLTVRALREGGWRYPARFALVTLLVGGVNATALVYAGVAPVLWVPFAVWVLREVPWRRALGAVARIGVLTVGVSLWWMAGLASQSGYGLPILRYTETVDTVARTSLASETLRGLGYWFFYGRDKIGPWIDAAVPYTQHVGLILVSFALPTLAFVGAAVTRWRHRTYFVVLTLVGATIAVGAYPYGRPSPLGALFKAAATGSTAGLAMRSTGRAVPLVVLGLSVLLGSGIAALGSRLRRAGTVAGALAGVLVLANLPPLWQGTIADRNLRRPEQVPAYWLAATRWLDRAHPGTRILEVPGADFAAYRWGNTVDPITPGLLDRPYLARELIPYGTPASADLLDALDRRLQEGVLEPGAIAPIARLLGVGDVVYRADLQFERYNTPRPRPTWQLLSAPRPSGLGEPVTFGRPSRSTPVRFPLVDEIALDTPPGAPDPPPVSAFPVEDAAPIVRAEPDGEPLVVAGDGEGLVDLAAAGLLADAGRRRVVYAASFASRADALRALASERGASLVLTDTNRRRARRWSTVRENTGYTEQAGEKPLAVDSKDARLDVFPDAGDDAFTVTEQQGVDGVQATDYGNKVSYTPEDRPARAFDGDPTTAWRTSAFGNPVGERLRIRLRRPVATDHLTLLQPVNGPRNRFITRVTVRFDGRDPQRVELGDASREVPGQRVDIGRRTFRTLDIRIDADNVGVQASYLGYSSVGLAEVGIGDDHVDEVLRLPTDLLGSLGGASALDPLTVVLTRARARPVPPRSDEELAIARTFSLPTPRAFTIAGTARLDSTLPDDAIDALIGEGGGAVARSSGRLPANLAARASSAFDGDPTTVWQPPLGAPVGQWVEADLGAPVAFDHLDLQVVADGRHSVPTRLRIDADGAARTVEVPPVADRPQENAVAAAPVRFAPLRGRHVRVTVEAVREVRTLDYYSEAPIALPEGIAELGIPGVRTRRPAGPFDAGCRGDLLTVDGRPVPVRLVGTRAGAEMLDPLRVEPCEGPATTLALGPGDHVVRARPGRDTGIDLDRLVLASTAPPRPPAGGAAAAAPAPRLTVRHDGRVTIDVHVEGATGPFWLVLGQSLSRGWRARVRGGGGLGAPSLVDGFANGWRVVPPGASFDVHLEWTPQRRVDVALGLSALAALACLALALVRRRRAAEPAGGTPGDRPPTLAAPWARAARPGAAATTVVVALTFGGATLVAGPAVGAVSATLVLTALAVPRARVVLPAVAVGSIGLAGLYTALQQYRYRYPPEFEWPTFFRHAHTLGWLAIVLLFADVLVGAILTGGGVPPPRRAPRARRGRSRPR